MKLNEKYTKNEMIKIGINKFLRKSNKCQKSFLLGIYCAKEDEGGGGGGEGKQQQQKKKKMDQIT